MEQNRNGSSEETLLKLFLKRYVKPIMKEVFLEFLTENELILVSKKEPSQQLLTTDEAAKLLAVERHTIYSYMKIGLPSFKVGKAHKFRLEDIQTFVQTRVTRRNSDLEIKKF